VTSLQIAPVRKSIVVQATTKRAFDVFTTGIDRWWPKTHGIGEGPVIESVIEPFVGGRADWKSDARRVFASEVEVRFVPEGPGMTRVELEHRNFERMAAPGGEKLRSDVARGWPTIMELFAEEISRQGSST
jgi:hypothetical protein